MPQSPSTAPNLVLTLIAETASYQRESWLTRHADPMLVAIGWRETAWSGVGSTANARRTEPPAEIRLEPDAPVWRVRKRSQDDRLAIALGRSPRCDVVIPEPGISKLHGYLQRESGGWTYVDAESSNGSQLDGTAVAPMDAVPIASGALLTLGGNARFLFLSPEDLWDRLSQVPKQG